MRNDQPDFAALGQSVSGNPPEGYEIGTEYTKEQIEEALAKRTPAERYAVVPSRDLAGMEQV